MDTVVRIRTFAYKYQFILMNLEFFYLDETERELYIIYLIHIILALEVERL